MITAVLRLPLVWIAELRHKIHMQSLLTINCTLRYDGLPPIRNTTVTDDSPLGFRAVHVKLEQVADVPVKWGQGLAIEIANTRTTNELVDPPALSWKPVLGRADLGALARFVSRYGPLSAIGTRKPGEKLWEDPVTFAGLQFVLRAAWTGDKDAIALIAGETRDIYQFLERRVGSAFKAWADKDDTGGIGRRILKNANGSEYISTDPAMLNDLRFPISLGRPITARVQVKATGTEIVTSDLWDFARLSFLRDHALGRTRVCKNPNCMTPYFVYPRRRTIYCCHACALATASRDYRKRVKQLVKEAKSTGNW